VRPPLLRPVLIRAPVEVATQGICFAAACLLVCDDVDHGSVRPIHAAYIAARLQAKRSLRLLSSKLFAAGRLDPGQLSIRDHLKHRLRAAAEGDYAEVEEEREGASVDSVEVEQ